MNTQRGFTLVELILVMIVIGILAAVAGPRFFSRNVFDERVYFEDVLATVRYAQKVAVASGCRVRVSRDSLSGKLLLHGDANCGKSGLSALFSQKITGVDGQDYSDPIGLPAPPANVAVQADNFPLTFGPLGCIPTNLNSAACSSDAEGTRARLRVGNFELKVHAGTGFIEVSP